MILNSKRHLEYSISKYQVSKIMLLFSLNKEIQKYHTFNVSVKLLQFSLQIIIEGVN